MTYGWGYVYRLDRRICSQSDDLILRIHLEGRSDRRQQRLEKLQLRGRASTATVPGHHISGGFRAILDLRGMNWTLRKSLFTQSLLFFIHVMRRMIRDESLSGVKVWHTGSPLLNYSSLRTLQSSFSNNYITIQSITTAHVHTVHTSISQTLLWRHHHSWSNHHLIYTRSRRTRSQQRNPSLSRLV